MIWNIAITRAILVLAILLTKSTSEAVAGVGVKLGPNTSTPSFVFAVASIKVDKQNNSFEHLTLRPDGLSAFGVQLDNLIELAYHIHADQLLNLPAWTKTTQYAIEAKVDDPTRDALKAMSLADRQAAYRIMVQSLLSERFDLKVHTETRERPIYLLDIADHGTKLLELPPNNAPSSAADSKGNSPTWSLQTSNGLLKAERLPMHELAEFLTEQLGRPVIDHTKLLSTYTFSLRWDPSDGRLEFAPDLSQDTGPSITTALKEQLGLTLTPNKGPVAVYVVDHLGPLSAN